MSKSANPSLHRALKFAVKAHKKQDRDGDNPLPYVTHPIEVLNLVRYEAGVVDTDVLCAAVLHDVVEETDFDLSEIEGRFGARVADLVKQLTREEPDEETRKLPEEELWKIRNAMMMSEIDRMTDEAKIIKLADRFANLENAFKTKEGARLDRYVCQSGQILEHIDRSVCVVLWDWINQMVKEHKPMSNGKPVKKKKDPLETPSIAG
jgi:(p)ppGpp synthase/HD superfamily hydrolase